MKGAEANAVQIQIAQRWGILQEDVWVCRRVFSGVRI